MEQVDYPAFGNLSNRFITFEGGEGVGKTTQIKLLASWLEDNGYEVVCTREPGGTKGAEAIRNLLLFEGEGLSWKAQALGYMAARLDHVENLIVPSLKRGAFVLCDRFQDSTLAYQGYGFNGADTQKLSYLESVLKLCPLDPSMTFLLDMSTDEASSRRAKRDKNNANKDRYEKEAIDFHKRVREGFLAALNSCPKRVKLIDASEVPEKVHQKILSLINEQGSLYKSASEKLGLKGQMVFGHEDAIEAFHQAHNSQRFPHGWLIAGPKGVGKHTLARYFAKELLQVTEEGDLHKFENGVHQGLHEIKRLVVGEGANAKYSPVIRLSQIQAMQHYLQQTVDNRAWRVVIIDDADRMNEQSANRLLKILEEPPERVVFFLISTTENILPTIRSRTRLLRLSPLRMEELRKALPETPDSLLSQVYGCPGLAYRLQNKETQVSIDLVKDALTKKTESIETEVEQVSKASEAVLLFLELIQRAIAERAVKLGKKQELVEAQKNSTLFSLLSGIEKQYLALNLDKESVVRMVVHEVLAV